MNKKMNLKKIKKINLNIFNNKSFLIFLISLFLIGLIIGIIFFKFLDSNDISKIKDNVNNSLTLPTNYNYLNNLFLNLKDNISLNLFIFILGISVIGILLILFLYFSEAFSLGFCLASLVNTYKIKGIIASFCYLFPGKILYLINIFLLTFFSVKFSFKLIQYIFLKKDTNLQEEFKKYVKKILICIAISIVIAFISVFIDPFLIKLWTSIK